VQEGESKAKSPDKKELTKPDGAFPEEIADERESISGSEGEMMRLGKNSREGPEWESQEESGGRLSKEYD